MWPGQQQPPGGENDPQDAQQNPYQQQPGTPNPYQQQPPQQGFGEQQPPGYGYPQPGYQTPPPVQPWGQQPPQTPQGGGTRFSTKTVAIVAAAAVVVTAAVTGTFVLTRDKKSDQADDKPVVAASSPAASSAAPATPTGNPRAGGDLKPVIPGWKVVVNPKHGTAFDVPPDWEVLSSGMSIGFEDEAKGDGSPIVMMSAPAYLKQDWCKVDSDKNGSEETTSLGGTGTKGGQGAKDTAEAARTEAGNWVFAGYAQKGPKGTTKVTEPKEYTTSSGLKGHMATASVTGLPKENKCSSDGKSIAFSFKNAKNDFATWVLYSAAGVPGEVSQETYEKILSSVRLNAS
ncbi:hypothetical protein ACWGCI_11085 [Streptomyces sp. NPDC054949]|uniref:hypothetical protein n=1 Tax=unclassified Streptomyces TaxID=2593676 RepID=UPI0006AF0C59|nr:MULTISPECIES: hypothetical protein [unclassified Streptomyces]KOU40772.1 membrane protein [Streptomyces sp. WM4235]MCX5076631.1 hypothetical protein [Streptomyces sp. NBC_00424]MCX5156673.1 hypothetical protein [Streptomyces sp. NBC_00291]WUD40349.1 hypothetical protein OHA84_07370 [Streptomyces sp. NBC_00513]